MLLYRFLTGKIRFRVYSQACVSVINMLRYTIPVNCIKINEKDTFEFTTGYRYKNSAIEIIKKNNANYSVLSQCGIPFIFDKYKKRAGLWLGAVIASLVLVLSSNIIWEVRVSGNSYVSDDDIINNLKSLGVAEGCFIDKDELEYVYNSFLISEPGISWISVNFDGTVAKVEVKETEIVPERVDRSKNINIVAKCDGVIKRADVFDGKGEVSKGETVSKGQLLISSFTETRKNGIFMRAARGNVWASTVHCYEIHIKKNMSAFSEKDVKEQNSMIILGRKIPLYFGEKSETEAVEHIFATDRFRLFGKLKLPFMLETETKKSYECINTAISYDEAQNKAKSELEYRVSIDLPDAHIIETNESRHENDREYVFLYELICYEDIGKPVEFDFE